GLSHLTAVHFAAHHGGGARGARRRCPPSLRDERLPTPYTAQARSTNRRACSWIPGQPVDTVSSGGLPTLQRESTHSVVQLQVYRVDRTRCNGSTRLLTPTRTWWPD